MRTVPIRRRPAPRHRTASAALTRPAAAALVVAGLLGSAPAAAPASSDPVRVAAATATRSEASTSRTADAASEIAAARAAAAAEASRSSARPPIAAEQRRRDRDEQGRDNRDQRSRKQPSSPREIAMAMLPAYGWDSSQFVCLDQLWIGESNWDHTATNPTSGAYGIPQALPAGKMATAGPDWRTNPATQIEWGLKYIWLSYGTPCSANEFKLANGWY